MLKKIKYEYQNMSLAKVASFGFKQAELVALGKNLKKINAKLANKEAEPEMSFRKLPYDMISADIIEKIAKNLQSKFDALVVVGIGGSDLGAKALARALVTPNNRIFFIGDTTDPNSLNNLLAKISLKKTLFYVVSKSGETLETLANFIYLREKVIKAVGLNRHKDHFIITTNEKSGKLLEICKKEGYALLAHYPGGGRFSVLSVNGLLPAAWLGLDIKKLLSGAREMDKMAKNDNWRENLPFIYAALHYLGYKKRKQNIAVLMPYLESLNSFAFWYRQLLAESLGKKYDLKGNLVSIGITPIASAGPKDQHSQLQLYNEGANDKIFTFIITEKSAIDFKLPLYKNFGLEFLAGKSFGQLLKIEHLAVASSLMKNQRANATLTLPEMNEYYLGQLFQFFELATVYLGELLGIDVFNQPGVEDSKKIMMRMLK